jgi:hypothetical protein
VQLPTQPGPSTFSPDSQKLIVASESGRVEKWNLIEMKRESVRELPLNKGCLESRLSSDGNYLACYTEDSALILFEMATGNKLFEKKQFYVPSAYAAAFMTILRRLGIDTQMITADFSPDCRFFAAGSPDNFVALDMSTNHPIQLPGKLRERMTRWFVFSGNDRVITRDRNFPNESFVQEFPTGRPIQTLHIGQGNVTPSTKGDLATVFPMQDYGTAVMDISKAEFIGSMKISAFDAFGRVYVSELRNGALELADYDGKWANNVHRLQLPAPLLGNIRAASISDDLKWLAVSQSSRGGLYNLSNGDRVAHVRGFKGAWFSPDQELWADFPKFEKTDRSVVAVSPTKLNFAQKRTLEDKVIARQRGPYFLVFKDKNPGKSEDRILEIHDVISDQLLWSRELKGSLHVAEDWISGTVIIEGSASTQAAKEAAKSDPKFAAQFSHLSDKESAYYFEILDFKTGRTLGRTVIDTGKLSFAFEDVQATSTYLAAADNEKRLHLYSIATGEPLMVIFADGFDLSTAGMLALETDEHRLQIYDAKSQEKLDEYSFASPIAYFRFVTDGSKLLVLTRDQTAMVAKPQSHDSDVAQAAAK